MLNHAMLRALRSAARQIAGARDADVSDLTDEEHQEVDAVLTEIIQNSIRIRSRLGKPAAEQE